MEDGEMRKKAMLVALLCVMGLAVLSVANAEAGWYTCTISQVGMGTGGIYTVVLTDTAGTPAFTDRTFTIYTGLSKEKEMYAAALTAWANSNYVVAYINSPAAAGYAVLGLIGKK